jgi:hypothetical protein
MHTGSFTSGNGAVCSGGNNELNLFSTSGFNPVGLAGMDRSYSLVLQGSMTKHIGKPAYGNPTRGHYLDSDTRDSIRTLTFPIQRLGLRSSQEAVL